MKKIITKGIKVYTFQQNEIDYISLTDIARYKDKERTDYIIQNWMRNRDTIEFLGIWERINNPNFKPIEFDGLIKEAGLNSFSLTPKRWVLSVNAIGIIAKSGRYGGGTFAHKDIAFEFASWISAEFKLYLIKEFQRLKSEENERLALGWDIKRQLTKINYLIHTDSIKENLIPKSVTESQAKVIYASEADILNVALFGKTAKEWRDGNPRKEGNIRDYSDVTQLVVLANLEGINAELIRRGLPQSERLTQLNQIAIAQMQSLVGNTSISKAFLRIKKLK
ncbi:MAG: KilA-N domain-containing protein [Candidatus Levybacteria bacterium]|nr:KilA-N domain-containing protein [Candidatus Levybacteria bacterium]